MINPKQLTVWHQRFTNRAHGTKLYRAGFDMKNYSSFSRRTFKTATEAKEYGARVIARWQRLYAACQETVTA